MTTTATTINFLVSASGVGGLTALVKSGANSLFDAGADNSASVAYFFGLNKTDSDLYYFVVHNTGGNANITSTVTVAHLSSITALGGAAQQIAQSDIILF